MPDSLRVTDDTSPMPLERMHTTFATPPAISESRPPRLYGLDWLRALAAVLVVMLHAAIPYMSQPLPGLKWSIDPVQRSETVNVLGWSIDSFIMPVFFLMNGYLAARLLQHRGTRSFVKHRLSRIGGPLLFGLLVILPMDLYVWLLGWVHAGLIPIQKIRSLKIGGELGKSLHGVSHLWFLEYVLIYCLGACLLAWIFQQWRMTGGNTRVHPANMLQIPRSTFLLRFTRTTGPLLIGILIAGCMLWRQPRIVIGFRHGWTPYWENLIFYAVPFVLGWTWERHTPTTKSPAKRWSLQLGLAAVTFAFLWPELQQHLSRETIPVHRARIPFLFAAFSILMSTTLFGWTHSLHLKKVPRLIGYLSKASFWIYLIHHPIVGLLQVDLVSWNASPFTKFTVVTTIALGCCLLTYEGLVRTTWLGQLLNGVREPSRWRTVPAAAKLMPAERQVA